MQHTRRWTATILLCAGVAACNPRVPSAQPTQTAGPSPTPSAISLKISGHGTPTQPIRIFQQRGNRKQYELLASSFHSSGVSGAARATFENVHGTFFDKDGTMLSADAPRGIVDQVANTVTLEGGVHAHNSAGMTLQCDQLVYSRTTEKLHGSGNVVIADPQGMRALGHSFESNLSLTQAVLK